jgi:hypothetical protein
VRGGEGPKELPPSCGWSCSIENNLFSKQREAHSGIRLYSLICRGCYNANYYSEI